MFRHRFPAVRESKVTPTRAQEIRLLRSTFIALSTNKPLRRFSESSSVGRKLSGRFVAGMTIDEVVRAAETLASHGIGSTLDALGENVYSPAEAQKSAETYHRMLDAIHTRKIPDSNVSLKLTQMGMDVDPALAEDIVAKLTAHAASIDSFVRVDMEGSPYTQATIDMVRRIHALPGNKGRVGTVIQAYLYRSEDDIRQLVSEGIRIRLCKGAYKEPASLAFPEKKDVDANYVKLMQQLITSGVFHGLATHDETIIGQAKHFVESNNIPRDSFEFQMLYGIRRDLQEQLVKEGYRMRVYIPFGPEWYPYFMRRLAERPANAIFIAKQFFRN
jgi:proline dehydrogenase